MFFRLKSQHEKILFEFRNNDIHRFRSGSCFNVEKTRLLTDVLSVLLATRGSVGNSIKIGLDMYAEENIFVDDNFHQRFFGPKLVVFGKNRIMGSVKKDSGKKKNVFAGFFLTF